MIAQVVIQALILCGLLYLIARNEADYSFQKVAMVVAGMALGEILIDAMARDRLGNWVILIHLAFIAFMIMTFCWINWWKSLIVIAIYSAVRFALAFASALLISAVMGSGKSSPGMATLGASESELAELQAEIEHNANLAAEQLGAELEGTLPPESEAPVPEETAETASTNDVPVPKEPPPPPEPIVPRPGETDWSTARRTLQFGATASRGNARIVYINGQHREVGDHVSTTYAGMVYHWRIKSIEDDRVTLTPLDKRQAMQE